MSRTRPIPLRVIVAGGVLAAAIAWVQLTHMRPSYDAFGWLDWGRQVLHWNLNTDGAPSWKPLPFLFTLPYAVLGANPQVWLWSVTATAATLAGAVFGARITYRLTGPSPQRPWAPYVAGAFAGLAVLGINGYSEQVLIANSDPMIVSLCLAAIDAELSGHPRLAWAALVLAALGRPEAWAPAAVYAAWSWRRRPALRPLLLAGAVVIPVAWFTVPALTSRSWFISGDLALGQATVIHGSKLVGVLSRLRSLYELPMQCAVVFALALAVARRDRIWLTIAGSALLWVVVEIIFAYHGWSAVPRYLFEPAAVLVVLAGAGVGRVLAYVPSPAAVSRFTTAARWVPPLAVLVLVGALAPSARSRARTAHGEFHEARHAATELSRLEAVIRREGAARIKACGQPVTLLGYQSELAWAIGLNVGNVGFRPGKSIDLGVPIVELKPHDDGWQVRPFHVAAGDASSCDGLRTDSAFGPSD
jgi:hypothetical protein